jgi:hypothetical protein
MGLRLFALSFAGLFLELMVIRWVPSVVRLVAYYANLMLISSFLGLGIGAMLARRRVNLFGWFPILLLAEVLLLLVCHYATLTPPPTQSEWRFVHPSGTVPSHLVRYVLLIGIFAINAAMFVPLGQQVGRLFDQLPTLRAYAWDLGGSLCGTCCFGIFALYYFSPVIGAAIVAAIYLPLATARQRAIGIVVLTAALLAMHLSADPGGIWSPYYYITVTDTDHPDARTLPQPPANLRTMRDPPIYNVSVNQDFYQFHYTIDPSRYSPTRFEQLRNETASYQLPYSIAQRCDDVLVLGSGGGPEVEAAVLNGARHVDAVDIDPVLIRLSRRYNASDIYDDPRVSAHVDDARAFLRRVDPNQHRYDLMIYGYLDAQALFSYGASVRLDGFTYTVESFRRAFGLLRDDGVLVVSFFAGNEWLGHKLFDMVKQATGIEPAAYMWRGKVILCAPRGRHNPPPATFAGFQKINFPSGAIDVATDDWPYLYLAKRTIPSDYLTVIAALLALSAAAVLSIRGQGFGSRDGHFLFMGLGFLLLQTKSIGDCSLYFGVTWLVTTIVITGVLLMVLLANAVAMRMRKFSPWLYAPLLASLVLLWIVPREWVLSLSVASRLAWAILIVPLPIFFAGLIFSTTFRDSDRPAALFGANLIGATLGGFLEYLGMAIGTGALSAIIIAAYIASLACQSFGTSRPQGQGS